MVKRHKIIPFIIKDASIARGALQSAQINLEIVAIIFEIGITWLLVVGCLLLVVKTLQ